MSKATDVTPNYAPLPTIDESLIPPLPHPACPPDRAVLHRDTVTDCAILFHIILYPRLQAIKVAYYEMKSNPNFVHFISIGESEEAVAKIRTSTERICQDILDLVGHEEYVNLQYEQRKAKEAEIRDQKHSSVASIPNYDPALCAEFNAINARVYELTRLWKVVWDQYSGPKPQGYLDSLEHAARIKKAADECVDTVKLLCRAKDVAESIDQRSATDPVE